MSGFYTKVAGVSFTNTGANNENRQRIIRDLLSKGLLNVGQELQLVPEPTNVYDRNAIMILAPDKRQIGCNPSNLSFAINFTKNSSNQPKHLYCKAIWKRNA